MSHPAPLVSTRFRPAAGIALRACLLLPALALGPRLHAATAAPGTAVFSAADQKTAATLRDRALAGSDAYALVGSLTGEVGPRLAGSPGDRAAVAWAQAKLTELGFARVRIQPVTVPHWVRGEASVVLAGNPPRALVCASLGGSIGTPDEGLSAPVRRYAGLAALKAAPEGSLAGQIAYVSARMPRSRDGAGYGPTVEARNTGPAIAAAKGAIGFLLRSVGTDHDRIAHTGITEHAADTAPIPAIAISNPDADLLDRRVASGGAVTVTLRSSARTLPPALSANVIGEIIGRERPDEVVVLGAHLDSWDLGEGAIDDGAGVAIVTAAARTILAAGEAPRRTIRVVLYAYEEGGGAGSQVYAHATAGTPEPHYAALEADSGSGRVFRVKSAVAAGNEAALASLVRVLAPLGIVAERGQAHGGADIAPLHERGVPVFDLGQDATTYFDVHHTANDTLAQIDRKDLDQAVAAFTATAWLLANANGSLGPALPEEAARR